MTIQRLCFIELERCALSVGKPTDGESHRANTRYQIKLIFYLLATKYLLQIYETRNNKSLVYNVVNSCQTMHLYSTSYMIART